MESRLSIKLLLNFEGVKKVLNSYTQAEDHQTARTFDDFDELKKQTTMTAAESEPLALMFTNLVAKTTPEPKSVKFTLGTGSKSATNISNRKVQATKKNLIVAAVTLESVAKGS